MACVGSCVAHSAPLACASWRPAASGVALLLPRPGSAASARSRISSEPSTSSRVKAAHSRSAAQTAVRPPWASITYASPCHTRSSPPPSSSNVTSLSE
eukprot:scaffold4623_cov104-Isochrysis_galbana.AAC.5